MPDSPGPRGLVYVDCDIPEGMTIREWRARRAAARRASDRSMLQAVLAAVVRACRAAAQALGRRMMARVRARGGRHRAPRRAAPPSQGARA
jgi:hypothetical protein